MSIYEKLQKVQMSLKAPKNKFNKFGKFNYRSAEGILEAVKPLLKDNGLVLMISDDMMQIGDRYYIKSTCTLTELDGTGSRIEATAWAREQEQKSGSDQSQLTGLCSSYARKYALNGLFLIDDGQDSDSDEVMDETPIYRSADPAATIEEGEPEEVDVTPKPRRRRRRE